MEIKSLVLEKNLWKVKSHYQHNTKSLQNINYYIREKNFIGIYGHKKLDIVEVILQ